MRKITRKYLLWYLGISTVIGGGPRVGCTTSPAPRGAIDVQVCFRNLRSLLEFESALFTVKPKKI